MFHFIDGFFDPASGESFVKISYKGNKYCGRARLHPDDTPSELTGCRYAEIRAEIKALKNEYKTKKAACEECRKFVNACRQYKNFDRDSDTAKAIFRQLNRRIKEVNDLADRINQMEFNLKMGIKKQDLFKSKIGKVD